VHKGEKISQYVAAQRDNLIRVENAYNARANAKLVKLILRIVFSAIRSERKRHSVFVLRGTLKAMRKCARFVTRNVGLAKEKLIIVLPAWRIDRMRQFVLARRTTMIIIF
jgi:hypothetical protein